MGDFSRASPCFLTGLVIFAGAVAVALAESGGEGRGFSGSVQMGDETIICSGTHGEQDIASAFANSCNVAFAQIAQELGPGTLEKYTEQAGLTGSYSISGLPTAKGSFDFDNITDGQLGWAGVGQYHDQVNPAALMIYMGAIANGGKAAEPYLILRTESALGLPSLPPPFLYDYDFLYIFCFSIMPCHTLQSFFQSGSAPVHITPKRYCQVPIRF